MDRIENALRCIHKIKGSLTGYVPNERFMDTLANSKVTKHLKFKQYIGPAEKLRQSFRG